MEQAEKENTGGSMKIVIGGSGYIGSNLCGHFRAKGELMAGTYYTHPKGSLRYFNLENPDLNSLEVDLKKAKHAFICSSVCRVDECKRDEKRAFKINVDGTKKLIEQCFQFGIFPVFLSSSHVFSGEKGNYSEGDATNPVTVYGNHKKIIEDFLLKSKNPFLIIRLSKIYGITPGDKTLLTSWVEELVEEKTLKCSTDQILSPTCIGDVVKILDIAIEKGLSGVYNAAAPGKFSWYSLATMLKSQLNITSGEIVPCSIRDFNFLETRPLDTSMNSEKIRRETGFEFSKVEEGINKIGEALGKNGIWK